MKRNPIPCAWVESWAFIAIVVAAIVIGSRWLP